MRPAAWTKDVPENGETYRWMGVLERLPPGTTLRESWGFAVVVETRRGKKPAGAARPLYDMTLRRLTADEEAVHEVMEG